MSADSAWVGFQDGSRLVKVSIAGGEVHPVCDLDGSLRGASWHGSLITFATDASSGLLRVSTEGGEPEVLTPPDAARDEFDHVWPTVLPGGRHVLFTILKRQRHQPHEIAVLSLDSGRYHTILVGGTNPRYSSTGHIVFGAGGELKAAPFNRRRLRVEGPPVTIVDDVPAKESGAINFDLTDAGTLLYLDERDRYAPPRRLMWVDRRGQEVTPATQRFESVGDQEALASESLPPGLPRSAHSIRQLRLSPDGTRVALEMEAGERDIWIWDFEEQRLFPLTSDPAPDVFPTWTRDSKRVLFQSTRFDIPQVFSKEANGQGSAERVTHHQHALRPCAVTPDGSAMIAGSGDSPYRGTYGAVALALWLHPLDEYSGNGVELSTGEGRVGCGELSPDGRWVAYAAERGDAGSEVFVRPFPGLEGGVWQASLGGGSTPVWNPEGSELLFVGSRREIMSVAFDGRRSVPNLGTPNVLFRPRTMRPGRGFDVSPNGRWILTSEREGTVPDLRLVVVDHWAWELGALQ